MRYVFRKLNYFSQAKLRYLCIYLLTYLLLACVPAARAALASRGSNAPPGRGRCTVATPPTMAPLTTMAPLAVSLATMARLITMAMATATLATLAILRLRYGYPCYTTATLWLPLLYYAAAWCLSLGLTLTPNPNPNPAWCLSFSSRKSRASSVSAMPG